ncbi:AzlD family protein [Haloferax sulfurifontis]|uniref:Branched-chain amino acid transport n=1 Tax=Haloferax sulfurifontis ATCC BAA-897 TaxID=662480 RepID=M0ILF3_9EURY|nr:branched-chain amino acid transport [Haloferax sulfurifontis ATCC BAA-897]
MTNLQLDPFVVAVIVGMSVTTYLTKAGGLWLLSRINLSQRLESGLEILPGAIVLSILGPELTTSGPAEWSAAAVVLLIVWRTENVFLALVCGVGSVLLFRNLI